VDQNAQLADRKKFLWGLLLAWIPLLFFIIPSAIGFLLSINSQRATGLAVVAGGFAEILATVGFIVVVGCEVAAIVMLLRTSSRNHPMRTVVAVISVCCGGLLLGVVGMFLWLAIVHR
jgi:uncharacterized membrane protein